MCTKAREEKTGKLFFFFSTLRCGLTHTEERWGIIYRFFWELRVVLWLKKFLSIEQRPSSCWP